MNDNNGIYQMSFGDERSEERDKRSANTRRDTWGALSAHSRAVVDNARMFIL